MLLLLSTLGIRRLECERKDKRMNIHRHGLKRRDKRGFLLLELLLAFFILSFVVICAGGLLIKTSHMLEDNKGRLLALEAAQSALDVVKDTPLTAIGNINRAALVPAALSQGAITIQTNPQNLTGINIATVTITVSWRGAMNRAQQLQISTMRSRF